MGEAAPSYRLGDGPCERGLPDASLLVEGRRWRCGAHSNLSEGLQHPLAAALDRVIARLMYGDAGAEIGAVRR